MGAFGAGISLAIASSLMLLVVSSVIAFNGWPDDLNGAPEPEVAALSEAADERGRSTASSQVGAVALPPAVPSVASAQADRAADSRGATAGTQDQTSSSTASTESTGSGTAAQAADGRPSSSANSVLPTRADPVGHAGDTVRDTTGAVADVVEPVAPAVSGALQSVGAAGADTVDEVGNTVDHVVGSVLNP